VPAAPMYFPGTGKNVLSYAYMRRTSFVFVSRFAHRAVRSQLSVPPKVDLKGIENVFAAVGLGSGVQPQSARRGMLSQDLFESPNRDELRRSSAANGHGNGQEGITQH
jgi:hypothetical protein